MNLVRRKPVLLSAAIVAATVGGLVALTPKRKAPDEVYSRIRSGMTAAEVIDAAGKPDLVNSDSNLAFYWYWYDRKYLDEPFQDGSYVVVAYFSKEGTVWHHQRGPGYDNRPNWRKMVRRLLGF